MQRRHFLQLSALGIASMSLPTISLAKDTPLDIPTHLSDNPLLDYSGLPNFADTKPAHIKPAMEFLLQVARGKIEELTSQKNISWDNFYRPLESITDKIERSWHIASHLKSVMDSEELRGAYDETNKLLTEYGTWYGMYRPLYDAFNKLKTNAEYKTYSQAQKKAIDDALLDFKLSGIELTGKKAERYKEITKQLSELRTKFSNNVLDATKGWDLVINDKDKLKGLNDDALSAAKKSAESKQVDGYRFTLDYPSYSAIATYADDRSLRETMYKAYTTRASDQGPNAGKWDNTPVIGDIIALRTEMANLLGFKTYADYALATRMAENPQQVLDFLNKIVRLSKPKAKAEMDNLATYGKKFGIDKLQSWDILYLAEKQQQELYQVDKEEVRAYFPEDKALSGMFEVANRLFGITVKERKGDFKAWHDDVRFFDVYDNSKLIAGFYLDMYARENKRGGAWMNSAVTRRKSDDGEVILPIAHIVCNFRAPVAGKPALLLHDDVTTLFHEFGHAIHHMLTTVDVAAVSGINGVAWDAVEFPSQMLENWTWDKDTLPLISGHHETGKPLPADLVDKMLAAKNYHAARWAMRQLEFGLFDFRFHHEYPNSKDKKNFLKTMRDDIKKNTSVQNEPEFTRFANTFSHIFAGGYAAGYYSYMWADVLAVDAYSRFEKEGVFNRKTGQAFVDAFLGQGGSQPPMVLFRKFMGRDPEPNAFLRSKGILSGKEFTR